MKTTRLVLLAAAAASFGVLGFALYLQFGQNMLPCPWCIIQRYLFAAVGLICLAGAFLPEKAIRPAAGLAMLTSVAGIGAASWLLWVKANPSVSCGIDPLETSLNKIFTADLLPFLFKADGLCTTEYDPILGLSVPQWALAWFIALTIALGWVAFKRRT